MASGQLVVSNTTTLPSEQDWDRWMQFIREEYLFKDGRLEDVFESLKQFHPQVKLWKFRAKLKEWNYSKKLSAGTWKYIDHSIQKRKSQQKDSVVIHSGVRLSQEKVKNQTNRHKAITLRDKLIPPPSPEPSDADDGCFQICTPRDQSLTVTSVYEWPSDLPWLEFSKSLLPELMSGLRFLPAKETHPPPRKKRRSVNSSLWTSFEYLTRRTMDIIVGSEGLAQALLLTRSVDRIAGYLDQVIPATCLDDNLRRAATFSGGSQSEKQREAINILFYLVSNHLIMNSNFPGQTQYVEDARAFVDICQLSGLTEPHVLARLVRESLRSPTMTAVIDQLYEAAVNTETVGLVRALLAADSRINPNRPVGRIMEFAAPWFVSSSALEFALFKGSAELARSMLQAGADVNDYRHESVSPLMRAALASPENVSLQLTELLLQRGASIYEGNEPVALSLAIMKGKFRLIKLLHDSGADFTSTRGEVLCRCHSSGDYLLSLNYVTCLGLAASFSTKDFRERYRSSSMKKKNQNTALCLVKHILALASVGFDLDGKLKSDAMIHAAKQGYTEVISYLHRLGARVDSQNTGLCPIHAAVDWGQVESCRLLLDLGASARADYHTRIRWFDGQVSPLHVAVSYNSFELASLLIKHGVDIDRSCLMHYATQDAGRGFLYHPGNLERRPEGRLRCVSPLTLATISGNWEIALLLVGAGAAIHEDDLFRVASAGQHQLTGRMLQLNADLVQVMENGESALHASIRTGNDLTSLLLLEAGAPTKQETLGLALRYGQVQTAAKLIANRAPLSTSGYAWAFRMPDESMLGTILQTQISNSFIRERSPDGRTFLENAILSRNVGLIRHGLSIDALFYDSGALCAAVLATIQLSVTGMDEILREMLRRREHTSQDSPFFDHVLEDTAVSIAAYYRRLDIIQQLTKSSGSGSRTNAAVLPELSLWVFVLNGSGMICVDASELSIHYYNISPATLGDWNDWHDAKRQLISPIFLAIKNHSESAIELLLDLGYKADGHSLRAAISENISTSLTLRIIERCIDLNATETFRMINSYTPIHLASLRGQLHLVRALLDAGADINAGPWHTREKTLCRLIERERFDIVHLLLQHNINIDTPHIRLCGDTVLQAAAKKGHLGIMDRLLQYGADPNTPGAMIDGQSAIERAAHYGRLDGVQLLLRRGVITEGRGQIQYILAIYHAARAGYSAIVQVLKSHREWTANDEKILQDVLKYRNNGCCIIIHYGVDTEDEIAEMLAHADRVQKQLGHRVISILEIGAGIECKIRQCSNAKYLEETMTGTREPVVTGSGKNIVNGQGNLSYNNEAQVLAGIKDINQTEVRSLNEVGLADAELLGGIDTLEVESEIQLWSEVTEESPQNIQLGPHTETEVERERHQQILEDMLGEREASFMPVEWAW
ncbi:ankyrin [Xylariaceae sp. FL1651]|nr:ankyrin [Xylariaceae sp. FL1651]